ncbi:MAG: metallophosphoesterase, partial [Candidatus Methanomethylophilaceae archaeon]|nr:metallophosphoesterase [Candidatus Methanomethylophilaceae archaeon]
ALTMGELRDFCRQVNESKAEFLILGGDTTDELTSYDDMIETFEILSTVKIPVYYVYGNHDRQQSADYVGGRTYTD